MGPIRTDDGVVSHVDKRNLPRMQAYNKAADDIIREYNVSQRRVLRFARLLGLVLHHRC
jgi:hypothetical protein